MTETREIVLTRVVRAPKTLVWQAITEAKHVAQWWGPRGFTNAIASMDVRAGGGWSFTMRAADGTVFPNFVRFLEVHPPDRLVYDHGEREGEAALFRATIALEERDGKTTVTLHTVFPTAEARRIVVEKYGAIEGGKQNLERLEEHLSRMEAAEDELHIVRTFAAPLSLVWKTFTEDTHLAQWWGPKGFRLRVHALDVRPGGIFHYSMHTEAQTMWGRFLYREVVAPSLLVYTSSFSDEQGGVTRAPFAANFPLEVLNTLRFSEVDGKTVLEMRGVPFNASAEERAFFKGMHPSMQGGFKSTLDQLDVYLAELGKGSAT